MKLIRELGQKKQGKYKYKFAVFVCEYCLKEVEKIRRDGIKAKACSHKCYALNRKPRGAYKSIVVINKYKYLYKPEHPQAIGTKKLYVAEHRIVMEECLERFLTSCEIVHHIDEDTLNNDIDNLELMTISEHNCHHSSKRKRSKDGKFSSDKI